MLIVATYCNQVAEYGEKVAEELTSVDDRSQLIDRLKSARKAMPGVPPDDFAQIISKTTVDEDVLEAFDESELTEEQVGQLCGYVSVRETCRNFTKMAGLDSCRVLENSAGTTA